MYAHDGAFLGFSSQIGARKYNSCLLLFTFAEFGRKFHCGVRKFCYRRVGGRFWWLLNED